MTYYKGGHMMYFVESELKQLKEDAVKLYQAK
jgi:carboxypeptidase C (cathepsin A)